MRCVQKLTILKNSANGKINNSEISLGGKQFTKQSLLIDAKIGLFEFISDIVFSLKTVEKCIQDHLLRSKVGMPRKFIDKANKDQKKY